MRPEPYGLDERLAAHAAWVESSGKQGNRLTLPGADLRGVYLAGVTLSWADLREADLRGADLNSTDALGVIFTRANLSDTNLHGTYMPRADLSGADLSRGYLKKTDLSECRMVGAILRGAWLVKTDFGRSDLSGADLSRTYLLGTYFYQTILDGVDFTEADMEGLIVDNRRFDVSRVSGVVGTIGFPDDPVTIVGDGPERLTTVADLIETMNRRGARVATWPEGQRPPQQQWRWDPDKAGLQGPDHLVQVPAGPRVMWVAPSFAPRPQAAGSYRLDLVGQPGTAADPQPGSKYEVSWPGGVEADCYTDATRQVRYFETVPGTVEVPNPALGDTRPGATYVVHPADGRYAVVLRTDDQARVVEVAADPVAPVGAYGSGGHPLVSLLGPWPGRVSLSALVGVSGGPAVERLGRIGTWLADTVSHGRHVSVRLQVFYDGTGSAPTRFQVDGTIDGQTFAEQVDG